MATTSTSMKETPPTTTRHNPISLNAKAATATSPLIVTCQVVTRIPTRYFGTYRCHLYTNSHDNKQHLALVFGSDHYSTSHSLLRTSPSTHYNTQQQNNSNISNIKHDVLVRVHSSCFTGETIFSSRCDCAVIKTIYKIYNKYNLGSIRRCNAHY